MLCKIRWPLVILILAGFLAACGSTSPPTAKPEPARVEPIAGTDLKRVVLTAKAAERLDIQTTPVEEQYVERTRQVGGEIVRRTDESMPSAGEVLVRVPLSVSDLTSIDRSRPARVQPLSAEGEDSDQNEMGLSGETIEGNYDDPDDGDNVLYYAIPVTGGQMAPGQLVLVELPFTGGGGMRKVVPYSAVLYDLTGDTWVYINPEPLVFVRYPVVIDFIQGSLAVLLEGPPTGTLVATVGVAELLGAETGVGK